jgi:tetratricopeptide (TPR) repeat protein
MMWRVHWRLFPAAAFLTVVSSHAALALGDKKIDAGPCSIATGENASNNSVTCNFGLTDEQLKQVTAAAVRGATEPLMDRIIDISKTLGVTTEATSTLLRIVGEQTNVPDERLGEVLTKVANDYKRLLAQSQVLNPTNDTARRLVTQAKAEIEGGHFEQAHDLLRQATLSQVAAAEEARKLRQQAQVAEEAELLGAAESTAVEGDLALTERRYAEAADLFGRAAGYVPPSHPEDHVGYLGRQADALYRQGDELGNNGAAVAAIESYRNILTITPRERVPLDWAMAQNNLGTALSTLGERESGTSRLEEAVEAYRAALQERTRERVPLDWAMTQNNLGTALFRLGERESGTSRLEQAVEAYRAALEEGSRERVPLDWAMTQNNLGTALFRLGERESGTSRLEEAVKAYRAALEEWTPEAASYWHEAAQSSLARCLALLEQRRER